MNKPVTMFYRTSLRVAIIVVAIAVTTEATEQPAATGAKPNVILIVTDDQGYGDISCHGNPWLKTPNLDRLCAEGVSLENYHVDPVCTPTRAALMTGRYSTRVGAWDVTQGRQLLAPDEATMGNVFSDSAFPIPRRLACVDGCNQSGAAYR